MKDFNRIIYRTLAATLLLSGLGVAQTSVGLPDTSQTTTLTASVSEQATVTVPAGVTFNVTNVGSNTAASAASVTAANIVLDDGNSMRISVQANAADFTPPVVAAETWAATDVTWNAASWTGGTGAAGTLSDSAYNAVVNCNEGVTTCSTTGLIFTLGSSSSVVTAGDHTLTVTWRFESL